MNDPNKVYFVTPIITPNASADRTGLAYFTVGRTKIYRTSDAGTFWATIGESGKNGIGAARLMRAGNHPVGVSTIDTDHVGVVCNGGFLLLTQDGGATWTEKPLIAMVPGWAGFNSNVAFAGHSVLYVSSENPGSTAIRVVKSTDGGATFAAATAGLPNVPVTKLLVSPKDPSGNTVYASTWIGVYRTTNGGASWTLFGNAMPQVVVSDLYLPPDGSLLRASTYGRSVWEYRF